MENQVSDVNNNSNKSVIVLSVIVVVFVLALVGVLAFYKPDEKLEKDKEKEQIVPTSTPIPVTPTPVLATPTPEPSDTSEDEEEIDDFEYDIPISSTDSEEIKIAKTKLKQAYNLFGVYCKSSESYDEEDNYFCYHSTLDEFKKQFYSVYSNKLDYKDVYIEVEVEKDKYNTNLDTDNYTTIPKYVIKNNKLYKSKCTVGFGGYSRMDKFTLESKTENIIKINYVEMGYSIPELYEESEEYEVGKAAMTLVKENGEWKILKATIVDQCGGTYEIGKE